MRPILILVALLAGCAGPAAIKPPEGPFIVLNPPKPARRAPQAAQSDSPAAVVRDTNALQDQATSYVVRRDARPAVIDRLSTLTLQARRAATRARATHRTSDVTAARVAADALAAYLQTQASAP